MRAARDETVRIETTAPVVFVTDSTEYHVRRERCVAVRSRRSGAFLHRHLAVGMSLLGGFAPPLEGGLAPIPVPSVGCRLLFGEESGHRRVVTGAVLSLL